VLQLRVSVLVHQWSQRRCVTHNTELLEAHARVYRHYVADFVSRFLSKGLLAHSGGSGGIGGSSVSKGKLEVAVAEAMVTSRGAPEPHVSSTSLGLQGSSSDAPEASDCCPNRGLSPLCVPAFFSLPQHSEENCEFGYVLSHVATCCNMSLHMLSLKSWVRRPLRIKPEFSPMD
jgi:hypothetical protein